MGEIKLLPCPFCGGKAVFVGGIERGSWIQCRKCGTESSYYNNREQAIEKWNTRKPMERIAKRLEELFKHHNATKTVKRLVLDIVREGGKE